MAAFSRGYLRIAKWRGAPVLVHWSTPIGALVFTGFRPSPALILGYVGLVLVHELGHAFFVRRYGARVLAIEAHALGGLCTWDGQVSAIRRSVIAWGGVLAQGLVYFGATVFLTFQGYPRSDAGRELLWIATTINLWIIAINLIPVKPLDGATAWKWFPLTWQRWKAREARRRDAEARVQRMIAQNKLKIADALEELDASDPPAEIASLVDDVLRKAKDESKT